jgi:DNA-binding transcriptional LysR family regulator
MDVKYQKWISIMHETDLKRVDLNMLVILRALLQTCSVGLVARRLGMSQPAVSRALGHLRLQFDDRLLIKSGRLMVRTPLADSMLVSLAALLDDIANFYDARQTFDPSKSDRVFRIATTDYGAIAVLPGLLPHFRALAPNAGVEVVPFRNEVFNMLGDGNLDLVLYVDDPVSDSLRTEHLFVDDYVSLVRTGHPVTLTVKDDQISLEDYVAQTHALVTVSGGRGGLVDDALRCLGHVRHIALWLPYFMTAALVIAHSDLILTLPRRVVNAAARTTGLVVLRPPVEIERFGYRMIWHERTHADPASNWMRNLVKQTVLGFGIISEPDRKG